MASESGKDNMDIAQQLRPIMEKYGTTLPPDQFQQRLNIIFHRHEAQVYDVIHRPMWDSLPRQFTLLTDDLRRQKPALPERITMLDVGCGTGLASDLLLRTVIGPRIGHIDLLDTSMEMTRCCAFRAGSWGVGHSFFTGTIESLPANKSYDLVVACSLLHHLPDLRTFFSHLRSIQVVGGLFMHLQDPNGDTLQDDSLRKLVQDRAEQLRQSASLSPQPRAPSAPLISLIRRLKRAIFGSRDYNYLEKTNKDLLDAGIIAMPMSASDIWAVTDIHVATGQGISLDKLKEMLPDYRLLSRRTYSFFGKLESELPLFFQKEESRLIDSCSKEGGQLAAVWEKIA
jgi:ubiquinone/menaquinone biosynthesis C-methylase UbiE